MAENFSPKEYGKPQVTPIAEREFSAYDSAMNTDARLDDVAQLCLAERIANLPLCKFLDAERHADMHVVSVRSGRNIARRILCRDVECCWARF